MLKNLTPTARFAFMFVACFVVMALYCLCMCAFNHVDFEPNWWQFLVLALGGACFDWYAREHMLSRA